MRDEKVCPTCGGPLVWKGNVLDGYMHCEHCAQAEFIEEPVHLAMLKDEEQPTQDEVDANIKRLNREAGIKPEYAEWDDLCLREVHFDKASGDDWLARRGMDLRSKDFEQEYECFHPGGRRTGRTHGMVIRALNTASEGKAVIILAHNQQSVKYIQNMIHDLGVENANGRFMVPSRAHDRARWGSVMVMGVQTDPRAVSRGVRVFADHAVYESWGWGDRRINENYIDWGLRHEIRA